MNETTLEDQAIKWIDEAETDWVVQKPIVTDIYKYTMPWRRRPDDDKPLQDQDDLFDATAIEATSDFAADMQLGYTPNDTDWLAVEPSDNLSKADQAQIAGPAKEYQSKAFSEIRRSNFAEASLESYPDLAIGTCAMVIQDCEITAPIHCQAVPITDLLICRGVYGGVDFRCRLIPAMKLRDIPVTYPNALLPGDITERIKSDPGGVVKVHECYWRIWDRTKVEKWQYVLLIDRKQVDADVLEGDGSCPLIVARWRTDSTTAYGVGPLATVFPTIKTADQLRYLNLKALSFAVDPAFFYDDDGTMNFENGFNPGDAIARASGSKIDFFKSEADFDTSFFSVEEMHSEIRRALFQDKPQQSGDTPPTAAQWMDMKAEVARRMGAPFGRLTTEWQMAVFQRFVWLLEKRGELPKGIELKSGVVKLRPQSPLVKAQRLQKVTTASNLLQTGIATLGEQTMQMVVDGPATFRAMQKDAGDEMVVVRSDADIQQLTQQAVAEAESRGMVPSPQQSGPPQAAPVRRVA